jgi:diacylglycerol kinase (ATP)
MVSESWAEGCRSAARRAEKPARGGPWRIGVISNPLSGGNRRRGLDGIRRRLQDCPEIPHREVRTAGDVQAALTEFSRQGLNLVVVNSGDGTIQAVLTALFVQRPFGTLPLLALLNGGTTNMTHKNLGLNGRPGDALERLVAWAHHGDGRAVIQPCAVLKVQHPSHPQPLYGMFFGGACIFKGIQFFHARVTRLRLSGDPAHLLIMARFLTALARRDHAIVSPVALGMDADRQLFRRQDCLLLLITTLDSLILGLRPFWHAAEGPLRLTAVNAKPRHLLRALPALINGRANRYAEPGNGYLSCSTRKIWLDIGGGGFAIDGELFSADPRKGPILVEDGGAAEFLRL